MSKGFKIAKNARPCETSSCSCSQADLKTRNNFVFPRLIPLVGPSSLLGECFYEKIHSIYLYKNTQSVTDLWNQSQLFHTV